MTLRLPTPALPPNLLSRTSSRSAASLSTRRTQEDRTSPAALLPAPRCLPDSPCTPPRPCRLRDGCRGSTRRLFLCPERCVRAVAFALRAVEHKANLGKLFQQHSALTLSKKALTKRILRGTMRARRRDSVTPASAAGSILREEVQMDPPEQYQAASRRASPSTPSNVSSPRNALCFGCAVGFHAQ